MRRRLILLLAFAASVLGATAVTTPAHAATGLGKTGLYKDACGNTHIWVNGQDLGPQYLLCIPQD
jgi:hypothetical protein